MSRIGKLPIELDKGVEVNITPDNTVTIKLGKKQEVVKVQPILNVKQEGNEILVTRKDETTQARAFHGLYRTLIHNAVVGVTKGWTKELELNGVGYRSAVKGKVLELNLGYSHPINFQIPDDIEIKVEKNTKVKVSGSSRALVGQVAAKIRGFRPPEPYLGKGVKYSDEVIKRKAGKSASK